MTHGPLRHWRVDTDEQGIAWATLDEVGNPNNALSAEVMAELATLVAGWEAAAPRGVVFRSGKATSFIAGADIREFTTLETTDQALVLIARGWDLFNRLAALRCPTLALVRGHCLGGGLELALACRYLVAVDEPETGLALPEVMLGIYPAWGGMLRLPEKIGASAALDLMLSGRRVDAGKARRLGIADACVPARVMEATARRLILEAPPRRRPGFVARLQNGPLKPLVAAAARRQVAKRVSPLHYPAPGALIEIWQKHGGNALEAPQLVERTVVSETARNLVRVFFLQERLKAFGRAEASEGFVPRRVHVVGAGVMGGDIAAWCARRGLIVSLQDQDLGRIAPVLRRAHSTWSERGSGRDRRAVQAAFDRLIPDPDGGGVAQADVVIEAIHEDLEAKRALYRQLEPRLKPGAVLATNTSSLRLEDLRTALAEPRRLVGIHFFNPVARMPLVEVVAAADGDPEMARRAALFVRRIDRLPLPVRSAPGFLVNAVLVPYLLAALRELDGGLAAETIDRALIEFGMPMGPIELADFVGLDVALAAGRQLAGPGAEVPAGLAERCAAGHYGRKSGRGFYEWRDGKAIKAPPGPPPPGLAERLIEPLFAKAREVVADGVVADADLADAGLIFGAGFAPWTGGPLHFSRRRIA